MAPRSEVSTQVKSQPELPEQPLEQPIRPAVDVARHDDVIPGSKQVHHRGDRRHPRGEAARLEAPLEGRQVPLAARARVGLIVRA